MTSQWYLAVLFIVLSYFAHATILVIPESGDLIGKIQYAHAKIGESIDEVGRRFDVGYYEMVRANPHIDPIHTLPAGTPLVVPSQFILPHTVRTGIVINLAEYRLYYYPPDENIVITFPIGIGKKGWSTPIGITKITAKAANPVWRPTPNVRAAAEEAGVILPSVYPTGADNPLGRHVLRLGWPTFLIHGTNRSDGVGARVSAGCIRMLPNDIEHLFEVVSVGTAVRVINEPIKIGQQDGELFIQMHPLLAEQKHLKLQSILNDQLVRFTKRSRLNQTLLMNEVAQPSGLVKKIT